MHYLDDFFLVGPPRSQTCTENLHMFLAICCQLEIPIAMEKLEGPTTMLTFLGIEIDTFTMQLRLPRANLEELKNCCRNGWASLHVGRRSLNLWWGNATCFRSGNAGPDVHASVV